MADRRAAGDADHGRNINDWARVLRPIDQELAARLGTRRDSVYRAVKERGLPMLPMEQRALSDFVSAPEKLFSKFETDRYVLALIPKDSSLPRFSQPAVTRAEVLEIIRENVPQSNIEQYEILLLPYYDVRYGGNISVDANNQILVEFRDGLPGPVSYGTETPAYSVTRDRFLGSFKYNFEDKRLREQVAGVIDYLPHAGKGRDAIYEPGYYEFVLFQKDKSKDQHLDVSFIEYRDDPSYQVRIEPSD